VAMAKVAKSQSCLGKVATLTQSGPRARASSRSWNELPHNKVRPHHALYLAEWERVSRRTATATVSETTTHQLVFVKIVPKCTLQRGKAR